MLWWSCRMLQTRLCRAALVLPVSSSGASALAPPCTSSEQSLSFPGSFPKWVNKNLEKGFINEKSPSSPPCRLPY